MNQPGNEWISGEAIVIPQPKPRRSKKILFIVAATVGVAAIIGGSAFLASSVGKAQCLGADEYAELTDNEYPGDVNPQELFYSYPIVFQPNSTKFDDSELPKNSEIIKYLGEFYRKHSDKKLTFTLVTPRLNQADWYLSQDRLDIVSKGLIAAGIPESSVVISAVVTPNTGEQSNYDDESDGEAIGDDSQEVELDTLHIRITSAVPCS